MAAALSGCFPRGPEPARLGGSRADRLLRDRRAGRATHHAAGVEDFIAPLALVLLDVLGRDAAEHQVHIGKGRNSVNLYLANGETIALRHVRPRGGKTTFVSIAALCDHSGHLSSSFGGRSTSSASTDN